MRTILIFLCLLTILQAVRAKHVPQNDAQQIAVTFYRLNNPYGKQDPMVKSVTIRTWASIPSFYIFRFVSRGFVLITANDAVTPILGYSFTNEISETIDNPAANNWLDNYSREIAYVCSNNLDNTETLKEWSSIEKSQMLTPSIDVLPLLTTEWDQGCNYNSMCPSDAGGNCGHVYTGCVATAISQILKYHNFPPRGVGQHAYDDGNYGQQSADFGNTIYDWSAMPNTATSSSTAIQTLMHHVGVSMDMGYGSNGSGAQSDYVHSAFIDYFNYSPGIDVKYKDSYANVEDFKALLRADLDANLPVYYAGYGPYGGHDFVCDGYSMNDGKFHFNWGWGGSDNGYFTIGNLNPSGYTFNTGDIVTVHIKPYNPNLVVRITSPTSKAIVPTGSSVEIKAKVVRGLGSVIKIFIDDVEKISVAGDSVLFAWNITIADLGSHVVKSFAMNATDTVFYTISVNVVNEDEWVLQSSGFPGPRVVTFISAIDSNVAWVGASNAGNPLWATCSDFARTTNGGVFWKPGVVTNTAGLIPAMIFGLDSLKAYAAMSKLSGNNAPGIYMTSDGGTTWTRQTTASFSNTTSFPDVVHFFNVNDGVCMGNPYSGEFEIFTTTNGGTTWTQVPGINIPNQITAELGLGGCYSSVNDTIWFGTSRGRVFRSTDKGQHWTVSAPVVMSGKFVKPVFRNGSHGLLLDELTGTGILCESFDGGLTWTRVDYTGPDYSGDLAYVPGTVNTWVRSGYLTGPMGCARSFDGGHSWSDFPGTPGSPFAQMAWVNDHCGWSGGINSSPMENGVHKFTGSLLSPPVGIEHSGKQQHLIIYPNPAHGRIILKTPGQIREITIHDQIGHAMTDVKTLSKDLTSIDVSELTAGIYILSAKTLEGILKTKLVIY